ncbi:MAG: 4-hydroxyphenylpyruvate dioxygenase [Bacteriovoracaceae bacterium]|jgi:4-hydroxyphenylpyruvate dioxygenase|nr:4-hydroxyphenylpyruvate dioxygenase [Bacteriovoracaceae bacterium]
MSENYLNLKGIEFIEFSSSEPKKLEDLFLAFGLSKVMTHKEKEIDLFRQNNIVFLLNSQPQSFGSNFYDLHGPCVSSMAWRFEDTNFALEEAVKRGATKAASKIDYKLDGQDIPAIMGIGDSLIYMVDTYDKEDFYESMGFEKLENPTIVPDLGFEFVDHLTNNVQNGTMEKWSNFYKDIFGFREIKYFDIKGVKTGLQSFALQSPCGSFSIPINEAKEAKSQINEYLEEYKGAGVQHIALHSKDMITSVAGIQKEGIETLDIDNEYYGEVFDRVPNVSEDHKKLQDLQILIDGDEQGYLLQIFTKNVIGPIFFEIIQRKNHFAFGEGNFGALFRSIERDQQKRGYLD